MKLKIVIDTNVLFEGLTISVLKNLISLNLKKFSKELIIIFIKILNFWNDTGEITMKQIKQEVLYDTETLSDREIATFLSLFNPEDVFKQYKPEDVFKQYKPEDVFIQYRPEECLKGLDIKTIEAYLEKAKKNKQV
jgi:hypothetical protein